MTRMVLVADDSPTIQKRAVGILKSGGFEVETVSNGVAAIKRLATIQPCVILADVSMPGRDGYEVCDFVKKSAQLSQVPVLLIASEMEPYDEARGAQVGADGKIKKPFEPQELIAAVEKYVAQQEAAAKLEVAETVAAAPLPSGARPAPEFLVSHEEPEETPHATTSAVPDFSAVSEGVALAEEPLGEQTPAYSPEPLTIQPEEPHFMPQPEPAPAAEPVSEIDASLVLPEPPSLPEGPIVIEEAAALASEPVFIEEKILPVPLPSPAGAESGTMIFRAPVEIAEPVWRDETAPVPPPEAAGVTGLEPQLETVAPAPAAETVEASPPAEPLLETPPVAATSLDSFSLDDAAAGQVRFASQEIEAATRETVFAEQTAETLAPEVRAEEMPAEMAPVEEAPSPEAAAEPPAEVATAEVPAPAAVLDWGVIYAIVHKVVVEMSPRALPPAAIEELAQKLAGEIASEFGVISPPPQA